MSIFEVPSFISMPAVGIDISTDSLRFIEFKKRGAEYVVGRYDSVLIPAGIVQAGNVEDPIGLAGLIKDLAKKYDLSLANVALPEEKSFLVQMDFQNISKQEIRNAIELHLEEYVPIPTSECVFDYTIIPSSIKNVTSVIVCAFPEKIINQYIQAFSGTGILPKTFELQSNAMARAIVPKNDLEPMSCMGIDIGKDITNIFIIKDGVVNFSAILDLGGDSITSQISKDLQITFAESEKIKIDNGLFCDEERVKVAISKILDELSGHILKYFNYWDTKTSQVSSIKKIYLTGGGSNLKGIVEYLEQELRVDIKVSNPWFNIIEFDSYIPPISANISQGFAAAIGLAIKDLD